jgi:UDP-glucose 4-epimerase
MKFAVTGGSGFIGSNLTKRLIKEGNEVTIFDHISQDKTIRIAPIIDKIKYEKIELLNQDEVREKIKGFDVVAHFAASADIALGRTKTDVDLKEGILVTYNILESMRLNQIKKIIFPSSSAIYGNPIKIPTTEDTGMLFPTSLYGASKLAAEGLISAFCHLFDMQSWIFRLGNVVGADMTRGVIKDFIRKLKSDPNNLEILGDGTQQKDFVHMSDFLDAILFAFKNSSDAVNVFNLSSGNTTSVNKIAKMVLEEMKLQNTRITYTGGKSGWPGDSPIVHYDITKFKKLGWDPKYNSDEAVRLAIKDTLEGGG